MQSGDGQGQGVGAGQEARSVVVVFVGQEITEVIVWVGWAWSSISRAYMVDGSTLEKRDRLVELGIVFEILHPHLRRKLMLLRSCKGAIVFKVFDLDLLSVENFIYSIPPQAETKYFIELTPDH